MSSSEVEAFESSLNCADWHVHCEQICFPFCSNFGYIRFVFVNIFITAFSILVRIDYEQSAVILTIQSSSCVEPALNQPSDRLVSTHFPGGCVQLFATPWTLQNAGVGSCSLLQGIFPTQESNPGLLHYSLLLTGLKSHPSLFSFCLGYAQASMMPVGDSDQASPSHRVACSPVPPPHHHRHIGHQARKKRWELICALHSG